MDQQMLTVEITYAPDVAPDLPYIAYCVELDETGVGVTIPLALEDLAASMPTAAPEHLGDSEVTE